MFSSFSGSFKLGRRRAIPAVPPGVPALQILENSEFDVAQPTQTAWVSATGWGGNNNPNLDSGILIFTYVERTVSQIADIADYGNYTTGTLDFAVRRVASKTDAQNLYYILIRFLNASDVELGTYRYPESGNANTNGTDPQAISEEFNLPAGAVAKAEVRIVARETGNWAGQYGPIFDYVRFTIS